MKLVGESEETDIEAVVSERRGLVCLVEFIGCVCGTG